MLYEQLDNERVRCKLCAHRCFIPEGQRGICAVRENCQGTLKTLVYGKAISVNVDPIEKKPLFHFLPGTRSFSVATAGCNFRCRFCQNWQISQITKGASDRIIGESLPPNEVVRLALEEGCDSIAYTYTEPTIFFEYAYDTAQLAHEEGLKNVFVTNGYQTPETIEKMVGVIDAANVDLKSFSDDYYKEICGARLQPVLDSIEIMNQKVIGRELTTLVGPVENDSERELSEISEFVAQISTDVPWHISRFYPQYKMNGGEPTPLETLRRAYEIGKESGLNYVYLGNVPGDAKENTYCPQCGVRVIERRGYSVEVEMEEGRCPQCGAEICLGG